MTTTTSTTYTPISIDASTLIDYYAARQGRATTAATTTAKAAGTAPTAPWRQAQAATSSQLAAKLLSGGAFFDPGAAKLDAPAATADYKDLFALYSGLSALEGLAQQAQGPDLSSAERLRLQTRFTAGMTQLSSFLGSAQFKALTVTQGAAGASVKTTAGVKAAGDSYVTGALATGSPDDPVDAFAGDRRFSMSVAKGSAVVAVDFDFAEIAGPRSLSAVETYMNGKLADAGLSTRFSLKTTAGAAQTVTAGGKTFTLGTAANSLALSLDGNSSEKVSFSAPDATPAVYLTHATDSGAGVQSQLVKLDPAAASAGEARLFGKVLPAGVSAVRATATGADGSLYALVDVTGTTPDGQTVKGAGDTALLRYDSTGALAYTRTLGAAGAASGYALSVSPDGARVAITGAVTGALDGSSGADAKSADSFVTLFDAAQGVEAWTARAGGAADDRPAAVAWGADGSVFIAGQTDSGLAGASGQGGTDAYVQGFSAAGERTFATVYGTSGTDKAAGLVVAPDGALVTAGVENGHAVLRRFEPPFADGAAASATRDLGALGGGSIAGLGLADDGSLLIAGAASGGLALGSTGGTYAGGRQVFAATLSADLQPGAADAGVWWSAPDGGDATASALTVSGGQVLVAGQVSGAPVAGQTAASHTGFAVALDPGSGAVGWSQLFKSQDGQDAPTSIAVDPEGVSTLDVLGLPRGTVDTAGAADLVSNTSLRTGDSFQIAVGKASPVTITVGAGETLKSVVARINTATGGRAAATISAAGGYDHIALAPASSSTVLKLIPGPDGKDALKGLGLSPTLLTLAKSSAKAPTAAPYALNLASGLSLGDATTAKKAQAALANAVTTVRIAYGDLSAPPAAKGKTGGTVPAYLTAQIAQYQSALARLTGG